MSQSITIRRAEQSDQSRWDTYVSSHPDGSPFHLFSWRLAVEESYGHGCHYLYAEEHGSLVGLFPLVHIHFPGVVNELTALPYCDVGNCISNDDVVQDALLEEAFRVRKSLGCTVIKLRGSLRQTDLTEAACSKDVTGKVSMVLDLPVSSDELFSGFKSKLRSQIRKAEKNGISFRWSGLEELDTIYSIFSRNMHDLGSPVHAKSWLRSVLKHYKEKVRVGLAEFEGKAVGMGVVLLDDQRATIPWASTLREYNRLGPNMLLYWNFLKYCADHDCRTLDLGRSTEGEGTYRFKKQWGAQPKPLTWYSCSATGQAGAQGQVRPDPNKRGMAAGLWSSLPLPAANLIGPFLRKYISL